MRGLTSAAAVLGLALLFAGNLLAQTNFPVRIMAANITSGSFQSYEDAGIRIFQGLKPDIVAIQEFRYNASSASNDLRTLVNTAFGPEYSFYVEPTGGIPNGIVSRWAITNAGFWDDPFVADRGFAWAQIRLPGTNSLYVVSVHLYGSGSDSDRGVEANIVKDHIQTNFPPGAWVIVGGDFNAADRTESCVNNFKLILSNDPIPTDSTSGGDSDTNEPRNHPYDYLMPSFSLTNFQIPVVIGPQTFSNGLVFDSQVFNSNYTLAAVSPVLVGDSHIGGMQHMAVVKDFLIATNASLSTNAPAIGTPPQSQTNVVGGNATFTVVATGTQPLSYQWRFSGTNIGGATGSSYTRSSLQTNDAGSYVVVVTNSFGSVTSTPAVLTVNIPQTGTLTTLAGWDVNGLSGYGPSPMPATTNGGNITIGGLTRGPGVTVINTATASAWGGNGFDAASATNAITAGDFATFSLTANSGYRVSLSAMSKYDYRRSSSGPLNGVLQYQVGAGAFTDITTFSYTSTSGASLGPIDLSGIAALQNVDPGVTVTFRIVNYNGASGGNWYVYNVSSGPDLAVSGIVSPVAPNPPPAAPVLSVPLLSANQLSFTLTGSTGSNYVIQATTNLVGSNWISVRTNAAPFTFVESNLTVFPRRFYRGQVAP